MEERDEKKSSEELKIKLMRLNTIEAKRKEVMKCFEVQSYAEITRKPHRYLQIVDYKFAAVI